MQGTLQSQESIEAAARQYGIAPGPRALMRREGEAAMEAVTSGVYVTWYACAPYHTTTPTPRRPGAPPSTL